MKKIVPKEEDFGCCGPGKKGESRKVFPKLRVEHQFIPETKKWEVGKEYTVKLKLKMTGLSISKFQNNSEFDIVEYDVST